VSNLETHAQDQTEQIGRLEQHRDQLQEGMADLQQRLETQEENHDHADPESHQANTDENHDSGEQGTHEYQEVRDEHGEHGQ